VGGDVDLDAEGPPVGDGAGLGALGVGHALAVFLGLCVDAETLDGVGTDTAVTGAPVTENTN
jgi:hypothetical protein